MSLGTDFWKRYFEVYDILNMVIPYQELLDTIVKELDIKEGDLVLEAGCGTGNLCLKLKEKGAKVIGLDNVKEALEIYKKKDPGAEIVLRDLIKPLPFPENYFDKITCNNVLYALPLSKREAVLGEFNRVLKPGGRIAISNVHEDFKPLAIYKDHLNRQVNVDGLLATYATAAKLVFPTLRMFYYNNKVKKAHKGGHYRFVSDEEQRKCLEAAGFNNISANKYLYSEQAILNYGQK